MARAITLAEFQGAERALMLYECYKTAPQLLNKSDVVEMRKYLPIGAIETNNPNLEKLTAAMRRNY